jgi:hypothetical protein
MWNGKSRDISELCFVTNDGKDGNYIIVLTSTLAHGSWLMAHGYRKIAIYLDLKI